MIRRAARLPQGRTRVGWPEESSVDVKEIRELDTYLKKLFGNPKIRVVPRGDEVAALLVGEDELGELTADEDEGERSFNLRVVIQLGNDPSIQPIPALSAYLRRRFDNDKIRVVSRPKKTDSFEAYLGDEFLGVLFVEEAKKSRSYILELPILDVDLAG
jgi:hypothetical protein